MKNGFLKLALCSPKIKLADPQYNVNLCIEALREAAANNAKVVLFPELTLSGATVGDMYLQSSLTKKCEDALQDFVSESAKFDLISFIGLPIRRGAGIYNAMVAVKSGEIIGVSTESAIDTSNRWRRLFSSYDKEEITVGGVSVPCGDGIIYSLLGEPRVKIYLSVGNDENLVISPCLYSAREGANLILSAVSYCETVSVGKIKETRIISESERLCCAYATCSSSVGESGTDGIYGGRRNVASLGEMVASSQIFDTGILYATVDIEKIDAERIRRGGFDYPLDHFREVGFELGLCDSSPDYVYPHPFIPQNVAHREEVCETALSIASRSLAGRIERAGAACCVLGISGGLDSTLALLVAARATEILGRGKENVVAITMPCFGTTERTKGNAIVMTEELGFSARTIDIKASVEQHFADIGQDPKNYNVVYENSQARERTQILMDVANMENGIVVGTGDLSEIALGFATYNGDHMSMYSVNGSVPKTLMREIIKYEAKRLYKKGKALLAKVLLDVIDTPVSPELLPTDGTAVTQPTESIVGPYELHDFFIYYTVKYGFSCEKLLRIASIAFADKYNEEKIKDCLRKFIRRFTTQQFKRSCMPDGPIITDISLSPRGAWVMPSDSSYAAFLGEENNG